PGEVWQLSFAGLTKSLTVTEGMALADVAAGLAALVDASNGYSAIAEGTKLLLDKNGATATAPTVTVTPVNAINQEWLRTLTLSGTVTPGPAFQTWSFTIGGQTASYTVVAADLLEGNASALAR